MAPGGRRRLEARDDTPAAAIGYVLVPVALLLLAIAAVAIAASFDEGLRETIARNGTCNYRPCTADDIVVFAPITAVSTGLIGLFLLGLGLAPAVAEVRRRRAVGGESADVGLSDEEGPGGLGTLSGSPGSPWPSPFPASTEPAPAATSSAAPDGDVVTRLERLAELRRRGFVSEEEFQEHKARLLGE